MKIIRNPPIVDVLGLIKTFIEESQHNIEYAHTESIISIAAYESVDYACVIAAYQEDRAVGFAIVSAPIDFHTPAFGYVDKLYVHPSFRGTGAGRGLVKECIDWFDERGVTESYASSTAEVGQSKLFANLLKKYGFVEDEIVLKRSIL